MLLAAFVLGAITGAVGYAVYASHFAPRWGAGRGSPRHDMVEQLARDIPLDADQKAKLREILDRTRKRFAALRAQYEPQTGAIRSEGRDEIRSILRPEQQARFEEIVREMDRRRERRRAAGDPGAPPTR